MASNGHHRTPHPDPFGSTWLPNGPHMGPTWRYATRMAAIWRRVGSTWPPSGSCRIHKVPSEDHRIPIWAHVAPTWPL